jgi:1-hydroxycarotenoid 3,4-desaturase
MAGLAAAISLAAKGEAVTLVEKQNYPGGKMRVVEVDGAKIDAGPTVFTMKWVFEKLFAESGSEFENHVKLFKANTLARHAWDGDGHFDLFADEDASEASIKEFFGAECAQGFRKFSKDARNIFNTLQHTFIAASRPNPVQLSQRIGLTKIGTLLALRPFTTLWNALGDYFPDPRLQQLFGRYATYVGSSPYQSPATLMLIAHVEQAGVWHVEGGMHALALAMRERAQSLGVIIKSNADVSSIVVESGAARGVKLAAGEQIRGKKILFCGDISRLTPDFFTQEPATSFPVVRPKDRALSAITWNVKTKTSGFPLQRHNVFFSDDYSAEFNSIFQKTQVPENPTVYVCAQNRDDEANLISGTEDKMLCLINAPAFGDTRRMNQEELHQCQSATFSLLNRCGLILETAKPQMTVTQPADFENLFPGSGGSLYGRASHGWMASFSRPGSKTKLPGLYLAGGSTHPGAGVPMATLSGMLAAQQILKDQGLS